MAQTQLKQTSINSGEQNSQTVDMRGSTLAMINIPAGMTSTSIGFEIAFTKNFPEDADFVTLRDTANAAIGLTINTSASAVSVDPRSFFGAQWLRLVAGSAEGANRDFILTVKDIA